MTWKPIKIAFRIDSHDVISRFVTEYAPFLLKPAMWKITRNRASNDDVYDIVDIGRRLCLRYALTEAK